MAKLLTLLEHFDRLIHLHESVDQPAGNGLKHLAFSPRPMIRLVAGCPRLMGKVDPKLVDVFRGLISGQKPWPLFLHGGVGAGKTLAALSLADFSATACYSTLDGLCGDIMQDDWHPAEWERIGKKDLAILDEIGERSKVGDLAYTTLKRHLDEREQASGRIGIYISNCTSDQLCGLFDKRIVSRLLAGTVFHLDGDDRRVK